MISRRACVLVMDACGVGALPDAASYGDEGTNTLAHLAEAVGGLQLPALGELGLGSIVPLAGVPQSERPVIHGRLRPLGPGTDSITGRPGDFRRTDGRRDFTLGPPSRSYLEELRDAGVEVHGVGKISDLFAGVGITRSHAGATNAQALESADAVLAELEHGLVFVNLIETDQVFGHRKDVHGFHRALRELDSHVAGLVARMRPEDLLILTADHGVDPAHAGTDHTREYAPLLALTGEMAGRRRSGER